MFKRGNHLQGKNGKLHLIWIGWLVFLLALGFSISWPEPATAKPSKQEPGLHTVTLEPVFDIWINQAAPSTNYNTHQSLLVGADEFTQEQQALMFFNLSSIPISATIQTARLEAYLEEVIYGLPFAICIDQITSGWGTAVTWNTRPSTNGACQSPTTIGPSTGIYYTWNDLSGLVETWVQNPSTNSGLLLKHQPGAGANHAKLFASVRQATHRPRLVIAYTLSALPPTENKIYLPILVKYGAVTAEIPAERIAHAYHGMLLDKELKEIKVDFSVLVEMQDSMIAEILKAYDEQARQEATAMIQEILGFEKLDANQKLLVKNGIIGKLLQQAPEEPRFKYEWRYRLIRSNSWAILDPAVVLDPETFLHPAVRQLLNKWLIFFDWIFPPGPSFEEYIAACQTQNVPTPPDWPDSRWIFRGNLEERYNFIGSGETKVYTYNDMEGVCFALPRTTSGLMGIICQSESTGRACFFDNINATTGRRVDWQTSPLMMANLQNGWDLAENCTDCHRGKNVFMIHPGSALSVTGLDTDPSIRYSPIGQSGWSNPGPLSLPPLSPGQSSCSACHEIPQPRSKTNDYCDILRQAATTTMPPGGSPAGWPAPSGSPYFTHIDFLRSLCP